MIAILFWLGCFGQAQASDLTANRDAARAFHQLYQRVVDLIDRAQQGGSLPDGSLLSIPLERLELAVQRNAQSRLPLHDGPSLFLEANDETLFTPVPVLPPENKNAENWTFDNHRFQVVPHHLWIYSLKFRGDTTVRLKSVTLFFRDGETLVYDLWSDLEDGNGQAFSKWDWVTGLNAWSAVEGRRARPLVAIEILGSAQDGELSSPLSFVLEVPDPDAKPYVDALERLAGMKRTWLTGPLSSARLSQFRQELNELAAFLRLNERPREQAR